MRSMSEASEGKYWRLWRDLRFGLADAGKRVWRLLRLDGGALGLPRDASRSADSVRDGREVIPCDLPDSGEVRFGVWVE